MKLEKQQRRWVGIGLAVALGAAVAAAAERLPLGGGRWLETAGPWRVEAGRVVFRSPEGLLLSLPWSEVAWGELELPERERVSPFPDGRPHWLPAAPPVPPPAPLARPGDVRLGPGCTLGNAEPGQAPVLSCNGVPGSLGASGPPVENARR